MSLACCACSMWGSDRMPRSLNKHVAALGCSVATLLLCGVLAKAAAAQPAPVTAVLDTLSSVHSFCEVAISPDARRVVYGSVGSGKRGGGGGGRSAAPGSKAEHRARAAPPPALPPAGGGEQS